MAFHRRRFENDLRNYYSEEGTNEGHALFIDLSGYEEITGESYPVQKEEEVAVAAAPVTETPQVPVTAETEGNTEGVSDAESVSKESVADSEE